LNLP